MIHLTVLTDDWDKNEIRRTQLTFERFTCMRNVPWEDENKVTAAVRLGLDHKSYMSYVKNDGYVNKQLQTVFGLSTKVVTLTLFFYKVWFHVMPISFFNVHSSSPFY